MSDWQGVGFNPSVLSTADPRCGGASGSVLFALTLSAGGTWPAANRALYCPVEVSTACTAYQMAIQIAVQSGNLDIGIYDELGNRLVHSASTAVAAAGVQVVNITDTVLNPGVYFLALNVDNTTASVFRNGTTTALTLNSWGLQQQAVGAVTLPDPATFANPASAYVPAIYVSTYQSTI